MHVRKLVLKNVRQFQEREIVFQPGFNLLVGENGAGKTTLLRSLAAVLGGRDGKERRAVLTDQDIRLRARHLEVTAEIGEGGALTDRIFRYSKEWSKRAQRTRNAQRPLLLIYGSNEATCSSFVMQRIPRYSREPAPRESTDEKWLYLAETEEREEPEMGDEKPFGNSREVRSFVQRILSKFSPKFRRFVWAFEPYGCSIRRDAKFDGERPENAKWQRDLSLAIMRFFQERQKPLRIGNRTRMHIDSMGRLLSGRQREIMPSFRRLYEMSYSTSPRMDFEGYIAEIRLTPRILIQSSDGSLPLSQLSDGEKRLFSLFVDIARQLTVARMVTAVIMIDEIDVHLHPRWQREVVPALEDLFPTCQFIATTHSPFVVQGVRETRVQDINHALAGDFTDRGIEEITAKVLGIEDHQVGPRYMDMLATARDYFRTLAEARDSDSDELRRLRERLRVLSHRYARNPAYQAYLELHEELELGPETP